MCVKSLLCGPRVDMWRFMGFWVNGRLIGSWRFSPTLQREKTVYPKTHKTAIYRPVDYTGGTQHTFKKGKEFFGEIVSFLKVTETIGVFPIQILIFWMTMFADAHISSLAYLWFHCMDHNGSRENQRQTNNISWKSPKNPAKILHLPRKSLKIFKILLIT